jgi:hypothetical protein
VRNSNSAGITEETFTYSIPGLGWFPAEPSAARIALTVIGQPAGPASVGDQRGGEACGIRVLPNPVVGSARFRIGVPARQRVRIGVVDVVGRRVATLVDGPLAAGEHEFRWDGTTAWGTRSHAGLYFLRVEFEHSQLTRRFVLIEAHP